jgi:HK97 family phage portal protein
LALFRRNRPEPAAESRTATLGALQSILDRSGLTAAGVVVDGDKALTNSAVWACQELIAGVGSSLPLDEYRKASTEQIAVPLSSLFADPDPDPSVTAVAFRAQILRSAVARGNAYADLLGAEMGTPTGAVTIHPDRVRWRYEHTANGYTWQVYVDGKPRSRWPYGDLWHFPLFQQPGSPVGLNPVEYHRLSIGASLAAQKFGAQFFDSGGHPTVIIKMPTDPGPDEAKAVKARIVDSTRGSREPMIFPNGWELDKVTIPPEEAQFLETQRYGVEEIARIFLGGFVELIGSAVTGGGSITYSNREQRMADFIALSLAPRYLVPLESALSALLPRGRYVKHNVNALMRADLKARYESYKLAAEVSDLMGAPLLDIDEMRRFEDLPVLTDAQRAAFTPKPAAAMPAARSTVASVAPVEGRATPDVHLHLSETREVRVDAPVTVQVPDQRPNVYVSVEPTPVQITNEVGVPEVRVDAPVTVSPTVTAPDVFVTVTEPDKGPTRKNVIRDGRGQIVAIEED